MRKTPPKSRKALDIKADEVKQASSIYRAILHTLRLQLIELIHNKGKLNVTYLIKKFKLEQPVISQQLKILRETQLLSTQRRGRSIFYSINYEKINHIMSLSQQLSPNQISSSFQGTFTKLSNKDLLDNEVPKFTERELIIIKMICDQKQNSDIAKKLKLSQRTVEGYRNDILKKMGARNTAGLVVYAIKNRIYRLKNKSAY